MAGNRWLVGRVVTALVLASVLAIPSAQAQIINSLRGFDDEETGWSGDLVGGVALAGGNTDYFEFELDGRVQYGAGRHRWRAFGALTRRTALGVQVAKARLGHLRHNYRVWSRLSSIAFLQAQHNPFLRIESRVLFGGGGRIEVFEGDLWKGAIGAALMRETEVLSPGSVRSMQRYRWSFFFTLYRVDRDRIDLDVWGFYQPLVDDFGVARASAAASIRSEVVGELYLFVSYVVRHDGRPPQGVEKLDYLARSGLGLTF